MMYVSRTDFSNFKGFCLGKSFVLGIHRLTAPTLAQGRKPNLTRILISKATYLVWDNFLEIWGILGAHVAPAWQRRASLPQSRLQQSTPISIRLVIPV